MGYEYNSRQTGHCRSSSTSILPILLDFEDFLVFDWVDTLCADQSTFDQKAALLFWKRKDRFLPVCYGVYCLNFQQYFSYIVAVKFFGGRKPEYLEKTTDFYHVVNKNL